MSQIISIHVSSNPVTLLAIVSCMCIISNQKISWFKKHLHVAKKCERKHFQCLKDHFQTKIPKKSNPEILWCYKEMCFGLKCKMKCVFLMMQEEIALEWIVMMSSPVNYFKHIPSVFAKCMIKCLLSVIKPMGVRSNDEEFKLHFECNEHVIPSKKEIFFMIENDKKTLSKKPEEWLKKLNNDVVHEILSFLDYESSLEFRICSKESFELHVSFFCAMSSFVLCNTKSMRCY